VNRNNNLAIGGLQNFTGKEHETKDNVLRLRKYLKILFSEMVILIIFYHSKQYESR